MELDALHLFTEADDNWMKGCWLESCWSYKRGGGCWSYKRGGGALKPLMSMYFGKLVHLHGMSCRFRRESLKLFVFWTLFKLRYRDRRWCLKSDLSETPICNIYDSACNCVFQALISERKKKNMTWDTTEMHNESVWWEIFRCARAPLKLAVSRLVSGLVGNAQFDYAHGTPTNTFESTLWRLLDQQLAL